MRDLRPNASTAAAPFARCGSCRHVYTHEAWTTLEVALTLTSGQVESNVTAWPAGVSIEVRRCRSCGELVARKARAI